MNLHAPSSVEVANLPAMTEIVQNSDASYPRPCIRVTKCMCTPNCIFIYQPRGIRHAANEMGRINVTWTTMVRALVRSIYSRLPLIRPDDQSRKYAENSKFDRERKILTNRDLFERDISFVCSIASQAIP